MANKVNTNNVQEGKFTNMNKEENSNQEPKKEGKAKKVLRAIGREAMFTLIGAAAVGAIWGATAKSGKKSKNEESSEEVKTESDTDSVSEKATE